MKAMYKGEETFVKKKVDTDLVKEWEKSQEGFTHIGKLYGCSCYLKFIDDGGFECKGTTWWNDAAMEFFIWIEVNIGINEEGFPIFVERELESNENFHSIL